LHLQASQYEHVLTTEVLNSATVEANSLTLDNEYHRVKGTSSCWLLTQLV